MATLNLGRVTGATVISAAFNGDDIVFAKDDESTITLTGAKTALKGDPGAMQSVAVDGIARQPDGSGVVDLSPDFARYALMRKTTPAPIAQVYPVPGSPLDVVVECVAVQSGSGDPSPENVRPILPAVVAGGSAKVARTGANLYGGPHLLIGKVIDAATTGIIVNNALYNTLYLPVKPGEVYTATGFYGVSGGYLGVVFYNANGIRISHLNTTGFPRTITIPADCYYLGTSSAQATTPMLQKGSIATPYEPYQGADYTFATQQPLYGLPGAPDWVASDGSEGHGFSRNCHIINRGCRIIGCRSRIICIFSRFLTGRNLSQQLSQRSKAFPGADQFICGPALYVCSHAQRRTDYIRILRQLH